MYNGVGVLKNAGGPLNLTYEEHFKSHRADGRHTSTLAAHMEMLRNLSPLCSCPKDLTEENFAQFQKDVRKYAIELLNMPEPTPQPTPVLLDSVQRDGYRVEKWEFYPDDYTAVPFLALIPDGACEETPVPAVLCYLGSNHPKEFAAGEPCPDHPNYVTPHHADRNQMGLQVVQNGMAAFVFDNPGIGETSIMTPTEIGQSQMYTRSVLCHGLLDSGLPYVGLTVFQRMQFVDQFLVKLPYVDQEKIAITSHSLGTEAAIFQGVIDARIKGIVFNEDLHDDRRRYMCITEHPGDRMFQNYGNWHIVPGQFATFGYQDMCAAFAPRYLGMTEGGADEWMNTIKRAYAFCGAEDRLITNYYTDYLDPEKRNMNVDVPNYGISSSEFYQKYMYVTVSDHSYRGSPAMKLLKMCFGMD